MVGLLIITHDCVGTSLLDTAVNMLGHCPLAVRAISVPADCDPDECLTRARRYAAEVNDGDGVLVLTDMYGSTPSNIAGRVAQRERALVISGLNLPMLIRVLNYPRLSLRELAVKAESGGRDGIFVCVPGVGL